jgi:hypothetical protein
MQRFLKFLAVLYRLVMMFYWLVSVAVDSREEEVVEIWATLAVDSQAKELVELIRATLALLLIPVRTPLDLV